MKLNKLTLKNYKKYTNKAISFTEGINIVIGPNEAGKSTISEAMAHLRYSRRKMDLALKQLRSAVDYG